jgi:hypothetical protein
MVYAKNYETGVQNFGGNTAGDYYYASLIPALQYRGTINGKLTAG